MAKHPRWCLKFITPKEILDVSHAVRQAEERTEGEIVPIVVRQSSRSGLLPILLFTMICFFASALYIVLDIFEQDNPSWYALALILIGLPVSAWLSRRPLVQRFFISKIERDDEVHSRAALEFFANGLAHTKNHTGVLIFLSLMERTCVVLADEGIANKLPPETWNGIVEKVITGIRSGRPAEGLIKALEECGRILSTHFPSHGKHDNQLSNQLIIKE